MKVVKYLIDECTWPPNRIHFFGFGQGGTVAAEFGISWWEEQSQSPRRIRDTVQLEKDEDSTKPSLSLGSIVSISGPLLSYPTPSSLSFTPILIIHDLPPAESALPPGFIAAFKKAYKHVAEVINSKRPGMPSSKEGWQPIMEFWSRHLGRRQVDGLYEVMSGITPAA
jgi:predicted esterase